MAHSYGLMELESALKLAIHLCEFKSLAFGDATAFSKIGMVDLGFWVDRAKPLSLVLQRLSKLDGLHPDATQMVADVIAKALDVLKVGTDIGEVAWINICLDGTSEIMLSLLQAMSQTLSDLAKQVQFSGESTQMYFRHLTGIVISIDSLKKSILGEYFIPNHLDKILSQFRNVLDGIALVAAARIDADPLINEVSSFCSTPALNLVEDDITSLRLIGFHVHELAAYAMSSYNIVFERLLHILHELIPKRLDIIREKDQYESIITIQLLLQRRHHILEMLSLNKRVLSTRYQFVFNSHVDCSKLVGALHAEGYHRCDCREDVCIYVSPGLASNPERLRMFLTLDIKRLDMFSGDFVIVIPKKVCSPCPDMKWKSVSLCLDWHVIVPTVENGFVIYAHCYVLLMELLEKLDAQDVNLTCRKLEETGERAFFFCNQDLFVQFIEDTIQVIMAMPILQFKAKEVTDKWNIAVSLWDLMENFFTGFLSKLLWNNRKIRGCLCAGAMTLLRFACMNIRMNYLEPFTWAADILVRLTALISKCDPEFIGTYLDIEELSCIYNEFQDKWQQIERAAIHQWDYCVVFKTEITNLQVAAYSLDQALYMASKFIPGVTPLRHIQNNFLLHYPTPIKPPIFGFCELKGLKLVSNLKRKQWIETFCCYDLNKRIFVSIKEMHLISGALEVANKMDIVGSYSILTKIRHPNLVQYYDAQLIGSNFYLSMEYCPKRSLQSFLAEEGEIEDERLFRSFCRNILAGLAYLHNQNIAHGDISAGNVLKDKLGSFKFSDFGDINRKFKAALSKVDLSYMSNTVPYMAPEAVTHPYTYDPIKADIWSFGCLLIELLTGKKPWHELEHDYAIVYRLGATPFVPEGLFDLSLSNAGQEFVKSCLVHEPDSRPSVQDLLISPYLTLSHHS